jgi:hypothetical protein
MDEFDPYPILLGIDWAFESNVVLNLKKRHMSFEAETLCMVAPIDPHEGDRCNEPVDEYVKHFSIEKIYNTSRHGEDYISPTAYGELSWKSVNYYHTNSEDSMERWKKKLYEALTWRCMHIIVKVHEEEFISYRYDGSDAMDLFISGYNTFLNTTRLVLWIQCL